MKTHFIFFCALILISININAQCPSNATSTTDSKTDNVQLAGNTITLNNNSSASGCVTYTDFTSGPNVPDLLLGNSYTVNITQGTCGGNYSRTANAWIDFNQDNDFADAGEMLGAGTFSTNTAGYVHSYTFTVPGGATLGNTKMRVIVSETATCTDPCAIYNWGETEDYTVDIQAGGPMTYVSATTTQNNTSNVQTCANNQEIIGIEVVTSGSTSPFNATSFRVRTNGSTSPAITANVTNIDIYYTGTSSTFAPTTLFGSAAPQVAGTNIDINGSQALSTGTNYFWVVYDMNPSATVGHLVDAQCTRVTMSGGVGNQTPSTTAPAGNRTIVICDPSPGGAGTTNLTAWWKADALANGNVNSWTTSYPTGGSAVTVTDGSAPYAQCTNTPAANIFNYNSVVNFNGNSVASNRYLTNTSALNLLTNQNAGDKGSFFVVYALPTAGNTDGVVTYKNGLDGIQMRGWGRLALGATNSTNGTRNFTPAAVTKPLIISYKGNKSSGTSMTGFRNDNIFTAATASSALMNQGLTFGAKQTALGVWGEHFAGYMSEVIFFNDDLSSADINKVHSYVAIKYGITLDNTGGGTQGDYTATNGSTIWDASISTGYHNDVIGIGRDDSQGLSQKQSHTFDDTSRVYINTLQTNNAANAGVFSTDVSYVMIGDDKGAIHHTPAAGAEVPVACGLYSRLAREWKVQKTNFTDNFNFDVKLNPSANPTSVTVSDLRLLVDDDGNFGNGGTSCYFNGDGTGIVISYANPVITVSNISSTHIANNSTRYITIGSIDFATPLPVDLLEFTATCKNNNVLLNWSTVSEINNDYFTIEKSIDAIVFEEIATINGSGNSSSIINYSWLDENSNSETTYYRLKQTDFNGEFRYYGIKVINCEQEGSISIYPNPFEDGFTINLSESISYPLTMEIYDYLGRKVHNQQITSQKNNIMLNNRLALGTYTIKVHNNTNQFIKRIIKTK